MSKWKIWASVMLLIVCGLLIMGFDDIDDFDASYDMRTQTGFTAGVVEEQTETVASGDAGNQEESEITADAGSQVETEAMKTWPEWVFELTLEQRKRLGINENTKFGKTAPDGSVVGGQTWEEYAARSKELAKDGIRLKINGRQIEFPDQKPVIEDGRVLVPMRPVLESAYVQCRVNWDSELGYVTILDQSGREVFVTPGLDRFTTVSAN